MHGKRPTNACSFAGTHCTCHIVSRKLYISSLSDRVVELVADLPIYIGD